MPWIAELNALNPFVAYELDSAVAAFGVVVKNALQETREVVIGDSKKHEPKYKLEQLLDDDFKFPRAGDALPGGF